VDNSVIAKNDYNIAVSNYVEQEDKKEVIDIKELNIKISGIVKSQSILRDSIDKIVAEIEGNK
jgi:type I restriction enzyme M protein